MNHLLNKDWEYVLHIYEEEMKGSTGWGLGEELAKLMVSQTCCMKPWVAAAVCPGRPPGPPEALAAQPPVSYSREGFLMRFLNSLTADVLVF